MDQELTHSILDWLETPAGERDIPAGAELLLRLNRNRILYGNILRRPDRMAGKLEYELRKHLRLRLDRMTADSVVQMQRDVIPAVVQSLEAGMPEPENGVPEVKDGAPVISTDVDTAPPLYRGRRADHDSLPPEIRELWVRNGDIYARIKQTYNTLLGMEKAAPCDRYEHLKVLKDLDDAYRANWAKYDAYKLSYAPSAKDFPIVLDASGKAYVDQPPMPDEPESKVEQPPMPDAKAVSAARKYISDNARKLEGTDKDDPGYTALLAAMQERVALVQLSGGSFKPDYQAKLETLGLQFDS